MLAPVFSPVLAPVLSPVLRPVLTPVLTPVLVIRRAGQRLPGAAVGQFESNQTPVWLESAMLYICILFNIDPVYVFLLPYVIYDTTYVIYREIYIYIYVCSPKRSRGRWAWASRPASLGSMPSSP